MLRAESIRKSYGDVEVLKGINLKINKGEVVAIVGPSGAGKSTLLHILGTLEKPDSGNLYLDSSDILSLKGDAISTFRNENIGFVFQFHNLLPEFTALENAALPCFLAGYEREESQKKTYELLKLLDLEKHIHKKPEQLSGGQRQRVAVARALANSPELLLADEPTGSLDSKNAELLYDVFFKIRDEIGQTMIYATHDMNFASMADRVINIKDGKIQD